MGSVDTSTDNDADTDTDTDAEKNAGRDTRGEAGAERLRASTALGVGVVGGAVGALLGGGTGTVTVPALDRLTTLPRRVIHGTSGIANIAVAVVGAAAYALHGGAVDYAVGVPLMIGGVFGAVLGARLMVKAPELVLRSVFVAVLLVAGAKLLLDALDLDPLGESALLSASLRADRPAVFASAVALGVLIGAWSSSLGLGGGLLTVPALVLLFGTGLHAAAGTSLVVMLPNSVVGTVAHVRQGTASVPIGVRLAWGAGIGAAAGAMLALAIPVRALGFGFGVFVLAMAVRELRRMPAARLRAARSRPATSRRRTTDGRG
jgi:hypothetical protein